MWLKIVVPLLALGYIGYKAAVALEIARARRRGDAARVEQLGTHGFGFYRFVLATVLFVVCVVTVLVALEMR